MTNEELFKAVERACLFQRMGFAYIPVTIMNDVCDVLEKQIPKKPIDKIDVHPVYGEGGAYVDADIIVHFFCPCCGEWVGSDQGEISPYCSECGQKIETKYNGELDCEPLNEWDLEWLEQAKKALEAVGKSDKLYQQGYQDAMSEIKMYGLPKKDITGKRFGKLVAVKYKGVEYVERPNCTNHYALWECKCDCGKTVIRRAVNLKCHSTCGCGWRNKNPLLDTSHGAYCSYSNMMSRCYNEKNHHYKSYGGRGIKVCDRWKHHPQNFIEWALSHGWEKGLTLERKDVNGDYCPENCCWIPKSEQYKNQQRHLREVEPFEEDENVQY